MNCLFTSISRISFSQALIVSHLIAADRLRRHPDMWEENPYLLWVALPKPHDASRIALGNLWLAFWILLIFMMLHLLFHKKKRSGAAAVLLPTTDSVSWWAQSLTGLSNYFHCSAQHWRQKAVSPEKKHSWLGTWGLLSICHRSSTNCTVQWILQLPSLLCYFVMHQFVAPSLIIDLQ